jgi:hypothetical protein
LFVIAALLRDAWPHFQTKAAHFLVGIRTGPPNADLPEQSRQPSISVSKHCNSHFRVRTETLPRCKAEGLSSANPWRPPSSAIWLGGGAEMAVAPKSIELPIQVLNRIGTLDSLRLPEPAVWIAKQGKPKLRRRGRAGLNADS